MATLKKLTLALLLGACWLPALALPAEAADLAAEVAQLGSADEGPRLAAGAALRDAAAAELGPFAATLLSRLEQEPSRLVRRELAWAMGNTGEAGSPLLGRLVAVYQRDKDDDVRRNLLRAFGQIEPTSKEVIDLLIGELGPSVLGRSAVPVFGALGRSALSAVPALTEVLRWDDSSSRVSAAIALGEILAASPLSPASSDPLPAAVLALTRSLGDLHLDVRQQSAQALGKIGPAAASAVPALAAVLDLEDGETSDSSLHRYAAWSLGEMGKLALPAVPSLRHCFANDADPFTRKTAEAALRKLGVDPLGRDLDS